MRKSIVALSIVGAVAVLAIGWCVVERRARPDIESFLAGDRCAALHLEKDTKRLYAIAVQDRDPSVRASAWDRLVHINGPTNKIPLSLVRKICSEEPVDRVVEQVLGRSPQDFFRWCMLQQTEDKAALFEWILAEEEWSHIPEALLGNTNALVILSEKAPSLSVRRAALGLLAGQ